MALPVASPRPTVYGVGVAALFDSMLLGSWPCRDGRLCTVEQPRCGRDHMQELVKAGDPVDRIMIDVLPYEGSWHWKAVPAALAQLGKCTQLGTSHGAMGRPYQ